MRIYDSAQLRLAGLDYGMVRNRNFVTKRKAGVRLEDLSCNITESGF